MSSDSFDPHEIISRFSSTQPENTGDDKKRPSTGDKWKINRAALVGAAVAVSALGIFGIRELADQDDNATQEIDPEITIPASTAPRNVAPTTEKIIPVTSMSIAPTTVAEATSTSSTSTSTSTTSTTTTTTTTTLPPTTTTVFVPQLDIVEPGADQYGADLRLLCDYLGGVIVNSIGPDQALRNIGMTDEVTISHLVNNTRFPDDYALRHLSGREECVPDNVTDIQIYLTPQG